MRPGERRRDRDRREPADEHDDAGDEDAAAHERERDGDARPSEARDQRGEEEPSDDEPPRSARGHPADHRERRRGRGAREGSPVPRQRAAQEEEREPSRNDRAPGIEALRARSIRRRSTHPRTLPIHRTKSGVIRSGVATRAADGARSRRRRPSSPLDRSGPKVQCRRGRARGGGRPPRRRPARWMRLEPHSRDRVGRRDEVAVGGVQHRAHRGAAPSFDRRARRVAGSRLGASTGCRSGARPPRRPGLQAVPVGPCARRGADDRGRSRRSRGRVVTRDLGLRGAAPTGTTRVIERSTSPALPTPLSTRRSTPG